ncbi:GNAT family N-acetyltransferase [Bacillus sp. JCM 19041]|uniref:GNAT family N-acetyltransferase n=1 Tax=Bacillus sp. JCM 19041 TaxID=1460637 RepID=UPI0006D006E4
MEITEYNKNLAQATATMWNESKSHFGGGEEVETAQERHENEWNSGNIVTMLALKEDKVIGYCGLSEYKQDSGALYIPLLNAHPNYLGIGVGKALVLDAIKRTYKAGWPRLDLYTWPGNMKAVPLYKRCGFFWEEREETTHLMNFIPQVLGHELLKRKATPANWYPSLKRELAVEPDREKNHGFSVYTYTFVTEEETITVGIEHGGRSIYKIETAAYKIEWLLPDKHLFARKDYQAKLVVENKTGDQLHIDAKGTTADKLGITLDLDVDVQGRSEFLLPFVIKDMEGITNASEWKTQMICKVPLLVNGVPCPLACGYAIKEPLKIQTLISKKIDHTSELALEVSNQQNEAVDVKVELPSSSLMTPMIASATIQLKALETGAVLFPFELKQHGIEQLPLNINLESVGIDSEYETSTPLVIENDTTLGYFEQDDHYTSVNGKNQMFYYKESFDILINSNGERSPWMIRYPTFGEPLNDELGTKGWETIQFHSTKSAIESKMIFSILEGAALIVANYRWHLNKVEIELFVENTSDRMLDLKSIVLPVYFFPDHVYLPTEPAFYL